MIDADGQFRPRFDRGVDHLPPYDTLRQPHTGPGLGINAPDLSVLVAVWIYATAGTIVALAITLVGLALARRPAGDHDAQDRHLST